MKFNSQTAVRRLLAAAAMSLLTVLAACGGGGGGGGGSGAPIAPALGAPSITSQPQALTVEAGTEAVLRVAASGTGSLAYQWLRNGSPVAGATAAEYRFKAFHADNGASYAVSVTDAGGAVQSQAAPVRVTSPELPSPAVTVSSATQRPGVRDADGLLLRANGSDSRFQVLSGAWPVGTVFVYGQMPFKVTAVTPAAAGSTAQGVVLQTEPADAEDVFSDLKFKVSMNTVAYDSAGKPLSSAQLVQGDRRRALGQGQSGKQGLQGLIPCLTPKGEIKNESSREQGSEFGYEFEIDCSIEKLLGEDDSNAGLRFGGTLIHTGTIDHYFDQTRKTQYQEKHVTTTGNLKVLVSAEITPAMRQRLSGICQKFKNADSAQNYCEVKADNGATTIEVARTLFDPVVIKPVIGGIMVPMYFTVGLTFKVEVSATGEVRLTYTTKKTLRTGYIEGEKVNYNPPAERVGPELTTQAQGKVDVFFGVFVAAGVGESGLFSVVQTQVDLGAYAAGAIELVPPCARLDKGAQGGVKVTVGRSRWWNGWDPIDLTFKQSAGEATMPENCTPINGKVFLSYVVAGKSLYSYDQTNSTADTDLYNAQYALIQRVDPLVPKTLRIDLAGSRAPTGKTIVFDATLLDDSKQSFVNLFPSASAGPADGAYLVVNPGSNSYGDTLKLKISAYVPGNRAATEVSRIVALKFEPRLEAAPYYRDVVSTDGTEYVSTEFVYRGETASRVKGGYVLYDDGHKDPLEQKDGQWQTQATRMQNYCAWYQHDCTDTPTRPVQLVLYSVASKEGVGQVLPISYSQVTAIDRLELSPANVSLFDILNLKASGRGLKQAVNVQVPNCRNIQEKRSEGNVRMGNWATDYREFSCETTAAGSDLVASVEGYPTLFAITGYTCAPGQALWRGNCTPVGRLTTDPGLVVAGQTAQLWLANTWSSAWSVLFEFVSAGAQAVAAVANNISERVSIVFQQAGSYLVNLTLRDATNQALTSTAAFTVDVAAPVFAVAPLAATAGVQQVYTVSGTNLPPRLRFMLPGCEGVAELSPTNGAGAGTQRQFSCTFDRSATAGAYEGSVSSSDSPFGSSPYQRFSVNVAASGGSVALVGPDEVVRTVETSLQFSGQSLPSGTPVVSLVGDARASCRSVNVSTTGFAALCTLFNVGPQTLEVRYGSTLVGRAEVKVQSNVRAVTWTSPSTNSSGTVKFGETVTFTVAGVNLLADPQMGFAVQLCGVSNTETGSPSSIARSFVCNFNNEAGAVAGQMPGVVKDAPSGQVLFGGWLVPVETAARLLAQSMVSHTGTSAAACFKAGSNVLVSCTSAEALNLSGAGKQDGMYRDRNSLSYSQVDRASGGLFAKTDCVRDNVSGLQWEGKEAAGARSGLNRYSNVGDGRAGDASEYLNVVRGLQLCGTTDWRMPTTTELFSLIDLGKSTPGGFHNSEFLPNSASDYWAQGTWPTAVDFGVQVGTFNITVNEAGKSGSLWLRLVSGSKPSGFTSSGDEVLDRATGLVWKRCVEGMNWNGSTCTGSASTFTHEQAFARARNQGAWRVPNVKELQSLQDPAVQDVPAFSAAFPATPPFSYGWASTPAIGLGFEGYSYAVGLREWKLQTMNRSTALRLRLVRDQ
ncbi:DUF1566 domain-containing protein [Paucibacter sp. AS339]|uniref:Lcl domain-containing protein n=1 Tax=Paucibacter hankyongi TaxID=3133434 RepID=UPI00309D0FAE